MNKYTVCIVCLCCTTFPSHDELTIPLIVRNPFMTRDVETSSVRLVTASLHQRGTQIEFFVSHDGIERRIVDKK